jgi:tetratricopeptide (TPR) repeat protein
VRFQFIIILIGLFSFKAIGQNTTILVDSLKRKLQGSIADSTRSLLLAELSYKDYTNQDSMYHRAVGGLKLAESINFQKGIIANTFALSAYHYNSGDFAKSLQYVLKALDWYKEKNMKKEMSRCYHELALIFHLQKKDYGKASTHYKNAYELALEAKDYEGASLILNNLGFLLIQINELDSALIVLDKGIEVSSHIKGRNFIADLLENKGELYTLKGEYSRAYAFFQESIRKNNNYDPKLTSLNYRWMCEVLNKMGEIDDAVKAGQEALSVATKHKLLPERIEALSALYDISLQKNDYKTSLEYLNNISVLKDSLFSIQKMKEMETLLHKFEINERESEIKLLQKEVELSKITQQVQEDKIRKQRILLIGALIIAVLLLALALTLRRQNIFRKQYILVLEKQKIRIEEQQAQLLIHANEVKNLNSKLTSVNENLEMTVKERTKTLLIQTTKLENYAFMISHKLRGPVARLLGLIYLIETEFIADNEYDNVIDLLKKEIVSVDSVIKEINRAIE